MTIANRTGLFGTYLFAVLLLAACGGGGGGGSAPIPVAGGGGGGGATYTVSAVVTGLAGSLVLQDNGGNNLTVSSNGTVNFTTKLTSGAAYTVTVLTQPNGQECAVSGGSGKIASGNVRVAVSCVVLSNYWTWKAGSNLVNGAASYGTQGSAAAANTPGARRFPISWTDAAGNFWLFGGIVDATNPQYLNDLWEFQPGTGFWTWVSGSNGSNANGVYGVPPLVPGARFGASTWVDGTGKLWLFGGFGYDSGSGTPNNLNDLWSFDPLTQHWVFVSGSTTSQGTAVYSGTPVPGARYGANSWFDPSNGGNLYLFGGSGITTNAGMQGVLNDRWSFNIQMSTWTFIDGSTAVNDLGSYTNTPLLPGARYLASSWTDNMGNFWLFGGNISASINAQTTTTLLSDLWEFTPGTNSWALVSGSYAQNASGVYGTKGTAAMSNFPGARFSASTWTDPSGALWLFGGIGYDSAGTNGFLNDIWQYSGGKWTWYAGSNVTNAPGSYGALGVAALGNTPGARAAASASIDSTGRAWLFGGFGNDAQGISGDLNDLWEFAR